MKQKKIILTVICLLIVLIMMCRSCADKPEDSRLLAIDPAAQSWQGNQNLHRPSSGKEIAIPGFTHLSFLADSTEQKVNFFNPNENDCYFVFSLYVADNLLWRSGYCPPGNGYYSIELTESLQCGKYNAALKIECYQEDGKQLNGASIPFTLSVED